MEEQKKGWFADKKEKVVGFFRAHPEGTLTVLGGLFTLAGGAMKLYSVSKEYQDEVYMTNGEDVFKLPAKAMNAKKIKPIKAGHVE